MAMTLDQLKQVRSDMDRLDMRITELIAAEEVAREEEERTGYWVTKPTYGSRLSGAVRRASMDLTRSLADLRRY